MPRARPSRSEALMASSPVNRRQWGMVARSERRMSLAKGGSPEQGQRVRSSGQAASSALREGGQACVGPSRCRAMSSDAQGLPKIDFVGTLADIAAIIESAKARDGKGALERHVAKTLPD